MKMSITTTTITPLLLLLALVRSSLGAEVIISSESDFKIFVDNVNSGSDYSGTTVYLGSDITLSRSIDTIGNYTYQFRGIFDGQGHIINNLTINSSLQYTGLFGYSGGLTIRNVLLDDSCSITNVLKNSGPSYVYTGGIIGRCESTNEECNIENSVNMASVTFSGNISNNLYIGGIIGYLYSYTSFNAYVKNCVNYGPVTDLGIVSNYYADLGGIVGYSQGGSLVSTFIQNCLNHGTITHNGTSENLAIGGVVCLGYCIYIENCVSAGKISTPTTASGYNYIGGIVGNVNSDIHINYCYYTSDVNASSINGYGTPSDTTGTQNSTTDVDSRLVSKLNSNATSCNWANWFMLHLNGRSINNLTQEPLIGIQKALPNPAKEGHTQFWYKDAECTEEFNPATESASGIADLYAGWTPNNYTVTFDFDNGTTVDVAFTYNTEITYPEKSSVVKEGYTFSQWDNYHKLMPARAITVTAQWAPNKYTVTFDANGGNVSETSKVVTFNEKYGELPEPNISGYMFFGWFTNKTNGTEVTNKTIVITPHNHTLYAHWEEVTTQVEVVFNTKDLTLGEVKNIIKKYTDAKYEITKFESESGEIKVIIKFDDKEDAKEFTRNIKESDEAERIIKKIDFGPKEFSREIEESESGNTIKKIDFDQGNDGSFSTVAYPLSFFISLFI